MSIQLQSFLFFTRSQTKYWNYINADPPTWVLARCSYSIMINSSYIIICATVATFQPYLDLPQAVICMPHYKWYYTIKNFKILNQLLVNWWDGVWHNHGVPGAYHPQRSMDDVSAGYMGNLPRYSFLRNTSSLESWFVCSGLSITNSGTSHPWKWTSGSIPREACSTNVPLVDYQPHYTVGKVRPRWVDWNLLSNSLSSYHNILIITAQIKGVGGTSAW